MRIRVTRGLRKKTKMLRNFIIVDENKLWSATKESQYCIKKGCLLKRL